MIAKGIAAAFVLTVSACNKDQAPQPPEQAMAAAGPSAEAEKDKAGAAKAKPGAESRSEVQLHPEKFVKASAPQAATSGVFSLSSQLTGLTVLNTSQFALTDLQGMVTWVDASGNLLPMTTQLVLSGSIAAGATATFAIGSGIAMSGTIVGKGTPLQITFMNATVMAP